MLLRSADDDKENDGFYGEEYRAVPHVDLAEDSADVIAETAKLLYGYGLLLNSARVGADHGSQF